MPFVFLIIGVMLITIGVRGQSSAALSLLESEFTGAQSYIQWFIAVMVLGLVGYYKPVKPFADGLIGLTILTMILNDQTKDNLFQVFESALQNTKPTPSPAAAALPTSTSSPALSNSTNPSNIFGSSQTFEDNLNMLAGGAGGLFGITPSPSLSFGAFNGIGGAGGSTGASVISDPQDFFTGSTLNTTNSDTAFANDTNDNT